MLAVGAEGGVWYCSIERALPREVRDGSVRPLGRADQRSRSDGRLGLTVLAGPAPADAWSRYVDCGFRETCGLSTSTTRGVEHYIGDTLTGEWSSSGYHSSRKRVNSSVTASAWTPGAFQSHNASCYCAPGHVCGP